MRPLLRKALMPLPWMEHARPQTSRREYLRPGIPLCRRRPRGNLHVVTAGPTTPSPYRSDRGKGGKSKESFFDDQNHQVLDSKGGRSATGRKKAKTNCQRTRARAAQKCIEPARLARNFRRIRAGAQTGRRAGMNPRDGNRAGCSRLAKGADFLCGKSYIERLTFLNHLVAADTEDCDV